MDWEGFLTDHNIEFITRGHNVKKNNVNICCPFCGDDPSFHMGISLQDKGWGCWRSVGHAGIKPHRLIRALINCGAETANILAKQYSQADPSTLDEAIAALQAGDAAPTKATKRPRLAMPAEFKKINAYGSTLRFWLYLEERGFKDVGFLVDNYKIRCCSTGKFKDRIIIPIYINKKLVSWTSRALGKTIEAARYLALSESEGGLVNVFHTLWNWDEIVKGGDILFITEGPFDALKLDYHFMELMQYAAMATCTFGTAMSEEQALLLREIAPRFKRKYLLYDNGEVESIFLAKDKLVGTGIEIGSIPDSVKDPGEMNRKQVRKLVQTLL